VITHGHELLPKPFVSESEQRIVTRTDARDLEVSAVQLKGLGIARGKIVRKPFNGGIGIRHEETISAMGLSCHQKHAERPHTGLANAWASASLWP
jgi:hypothetical protein